MKYQITYERDGHELPTTLILPGSSIEAARSEASRALQSNGADMALIRDDQMNVIETIGSFNNA